MDRRMHGIMLLLLMIVMGVSVLCILSLVTARADLTMARRQAEYQMGMQTCRNEANEYLMQLDRQWMEGDTPEGMTGEQEIAKLFTDGAGHCLSVKIQWSETGYRITEWKSFTEWVDDRPMGNLYRSEDSDDE